MCGGSGDGMEDRALLESSKAIVRAKDGDVGPLIRRLRKLALRYAEDQIAFGEINCAADLLEAALAPSSRGRPEKLSTQMTRVLVCKFVTEGLKAKDERLRSLMTERQRKRLGEQLLTNRQRSQLIHREAAKLYEIPTPRVRELLAEAKKREAKEREEERERLKKRGIAI
jgi:hypothetical protein